LAITGCALVNARDAHHKWAVGVAEQIEEPLATSEAVLAEAAFRLGDVRLVLEMVMENFLSLSFDWNDHRPQLAALAKRYADRGQTRPIFA
jgi:hypothetical protein